MKIAIFCSKHSKINIIYAYLLELLIILAYFDSRTLLDHMSN